MKAMRVDLEKKRTREMKAMRVDLEKKNDWRVERDTRVWTWKEDALTKAMRVDFEKN